MRSLALWFALLWLAATGAATAATGERILSFDSQIQIGADGALLITERIRVVAQGREIKRGIYRDFPTRYAGPGGSNISVGFTVHSVTRNGREIDHFIRNRKNGVRVYLGSEDIRIKPGTYEYVLTYRAEGLIGFFDEWDELYWNVNGTGWIFPIDRLRATVFLPEGAEISDYTAYTGKQGARGRDYEATQESARRIVFSATRALRARENMSIVVSWPKGIVAEPTIADEIRRFATANHAFWVALIGFLVVLLYYLVAWSRVGRDPEAGTVIPLFEPPEGHSPASLRFIRRMAYDDKAFASAIVSMAVKGYLTIEEDKDDDYRLVRAEAGDEVLSAGERRLAKRLFGAGKSIYLIPVNNARLRGAKNAHKESLRDDFAADHFRHNWGYLAVGGALSLIVLGAVAVAAGSAEETVFISIWLAGWTVGCTVLIGRVIAAWRGPSLAARGVSTLFAIPFIGGWFAGAGIYANGVGLPAAVTALAILALNAVFYEWIKSPTFEGRALLDKIDGFLMYLTVAEKDRLEILHPPDMTPEHFEAFLPYAMALDVENEWSAQFDSLLSDASRGGEGYAPGWYRGRHWHGDNLSGFGNALGGGLAGAIASSSVAPGSSSGFGGGGGSGGGGGGGGGGGF